MMNTFTQGWYLIYTRPRHERKVVEQLEKLEIENFLPTMQSVRKWNDRKKVITVPVFPSYVFVKLRDSKNYISSLELDGVLYFVKSGKHAAKICDDVISNLKILSYNYNEFEVSSDLIRIGETLMIHEGPFAGFQCEVVEHMGNKKILVRVDILQRNILVKLTYDNLLSHPQYQHHLALARA